MWDWLRYAAYREGNTALHLACQSNQLKVIEILLQWGARANMTNASGFAPVSNEIRGLALHAVQCCWQRHASLLFALSLLIAATEIFILPLVIAN